MTLPETPAIPYPELIRLIRDAGVVGMGGAGFPTHRKLRPQLSTVIINGAECEPLLKCDTHLLLNHPNRVLEGALLVARATGAGEVVLAIKKKNAEAGRAFAEPAGTPPVRVALLADVYPSGDEFYLIHAVTGKILPPGAIPVDTGFLVGNAGTFKAIRDAVDGIPCTRRYVSVCGQVARPITLESPIGAPFHSLIAAAGGPACPDYRIIEGGVMMGSLAGPDMPVTKTTAGLIVLAAGSPAVLERTRPLEYSLKLAGSACCQCRKCTDLCSRWLLGHEIEPHKAMRLAGFTVDHLPQPDSTLFQCSGCGLCSLLACPFDLSPRRVIQRLRQSSRRPGLSPRPEPQLRSTFAYATVSSRRLLHHLQLERYDRRNEFITLPAPPPVLRIPCRQHAGAAAVPIVKPGAAVAAGQVLACPPEGSLGALIHAPCPGRVTEAGDTITIVTAARPPGD